jgi:hypothetical protein
MQNAMDLICTRHKMVIAIAIGTREKMAASLLTNSSLLVLLL